MADETVLPMTAVELRTAVEKAYQKGKEDGKREVMVRFHDLLERTDRMRTRLTDVDYASVDAELDALIATIERRKKR